MARSSESNKNSQNQSPEPHEREQIFSERLSPRANDALLIGCLALGLIGSYKVIDAITTQESAIVSDVPGQVETHRVVQRTVVIDNYDLGIEQSSEDIEEARNNNGHVSEVSYHPDVGVVSPDSNFDWVSVSKDVFESYPPGSQIQFDKDGQIVPLEKNN